jgi:hypothetical protein
MNYEAYRAAIALIFRMWYGMCIGSVHAKNQGDPISFRCLATLWPLNVEILWNKYLDPITLLSSEWNGYI